MAIRKKASSSSTPAEPGVKELKQSAERLQALIDDAPIGICNIDFKGKITYVNKRFEEVSGYSRDEVLGKNGLKLGMFPKETVKFLEKRLKNKLVGRPLPVLETQFKCKDGHWIWVALEGKLMKGGRIPVGFQIISRDITQRKEAEEALRESRERLRKMFESVTDGISVVDLNGVITETNQRTVKMHGFKSRDELLGRSAFELVAPRDHDRITANMRKAVKQGTARSEEYTLLKADGSEFPGELSSSILKDASGRWIGHVTIARDITERKRAEEALKKAQEQLIRSEKLAAIGQLAGGVGHELRNPLGAIKNAALYVRRKVSNSELSTAEPKVLQFIDLIDEEVESANKVITDLLSFSRVAKPTVSLVNASSIVRDSLNHVAVPGNIKVVTDVGPGLPMVLVDASQIRQVFINVVLNGLEAMPEGGQFEISARSEDESVTVDFTDTGCGIPESVIDRIFDPLFTTKPRGVGLGLAMSKSIMDRHGGDMGVKSKEGKGTTFTVSLPTRAV